MNSSRRFVLNTSTCLLKPRTGQATAAANLASKTFLSSLVTSRCSTSANLPLTHFPRPHFSKCNTAACSSRRSVHLTRRTEEVVTNPENAVWDPVREFHFRRFSMFDSLGFDFEDRETDEFEARWYSFFGFSLFGVGVLFLSWYRPVKRAMLHDWGRREAYRLVEEREAAGVPVIDIDYAPVEELLPFLPPDWGMYTCDVETDFTYYDQLYQQFPAPKPPRLWLERPRVVGAMPQHQRVLNDGSKWLQAPAPAPDA